MRWSRAAARSAIMEIFSAADASALMEEIVGQDEPSDKGEMQKKRN